MTTALLGGLALGLASSAHCAAMCGPLVLTVGRRLGGATKRAQARHALLYHAGRVLTYVLLAVPIGLGGEALVLRGFGRGLAFVAGALLLVAAIGAARLPLFDRFGARVSAIVARSFAPVLRWASARPIAGPMATGALNGLLPCGLVYAALTAAAATGNLASAMVLMAGFGVGTSGVLMAIALGAAAIPVALRARLRPVAPVVLAVTAAVLIVRGAAAPHEHAAAAGSAGTSAHHSHR
jgi:sulfite exporter TauE/SafE